MDDRTVALRDQIILYMILINITHNLSAKAKNFLAL